MKRLIVAMTATFCLAVIASCGGGSGAVTPSPVTQPTKAILHLTTTGGPSGVKLAGVGITVHLPTGVTAKTDSTGAVQSSVVTPSGVAAGATMTPPQYTPAQPGNSATLSFVVASSSADGFGTGEFVTLNLDVTTGASVSATQFTLSDLAPVDLCYANVTGMSASFTADIH